MQEPKAEAHGVKSQDSGRLHYHSLGCGSVSALWRRVSLREADEVFKQF